MTFLFPWVVSQECLFQWTAGGSAAQFGLKDAESTLFIRKLQGVGELFLRPFCQLYRETQHILRNPHRLPTHTNTKVKNRKGRKHLVPLTKM